MVNGLKYYRKKAGLTQCQVMAVTRIPQSTLSMYENGYIEPSVKAMKALSNLYRCSLEELLVDNVEERRSEHQQGQLSTAVLQMHGVRDRAHGPEVQAQDERGPFEAHVVFQVPARDGTQANRSGEHKEVMIMTRLECEMKILSLLEEIQEVYKEYNPSSDGTPMISMSIHSSGSIYAADHFFDENEKPIVGKHAVDVWKSGASGTVWFDGKEAM